VIPRIARIRVCRRLVVTCAALLAKAALAQTVFVPGDLNNDQSVNITDDTVLRRALVGLGPGISQTCALACGVGTAALNGVCLPIAPTGIGGQCAADQLDICVCSDGDNDVDGVCNDADACLGYDDRIDSDGDQIPDGCDPDTDAFEPNDQIPYPLGSVPVFVFPRFAPANDVDTFSFHGGVGQQIVLQVCTIDLPGGTSVAPLVDLRLGSQVVFNNANDSTRGCPTPILVPVAQAGTYVLTLRERSGWNQSLLHYFLYIVVA
jgi:hypothetical protein